jgi:GNAT superfamily N-acetyltransferase
MSLTVVSLEGDQLAEGLVAVAELRMAVFRDYPYLYDGSLDYERSYLKGFAVSEGAVIVAAFNGDRIIGVSTGCPMSHDHDAFKQPLIDQGIDIAQVFMFSESVVLPAYRGQGLGHQFFDRREAHARKLGARQAVFCSVLRPPDHVLKPNDYRPLDSFWRGRGYQPLDGLTAQFSWKEVGQPEPSEHLLEYWGKIL